MPVYAVDDLSLFLADFGVDYQGPLGGVFRGLLDQPDQVFGSDPGVLSTEWVLTARTDELQLAGIADPNRTTRGQLEWNANPSTPMYESDDGDAPMYDPDKDMRKFVSYKVRLTVDGASFEVREVRKLDDGAFSQVLMSRVKANG